MSGEPFDLGTFDVYRGDAWSLPIEDYESDGTTPVDLTAYGPAQNWRASFRAKSDSLDVTVIDLDTSQLATGKITLSLDSARTSAMGNGYVWDVQVTGGTVSPITVYRGTFNVTKDVTRP